MTIETRSEFAAKALQIGLVAVLFAAIAVDLGKVHVLRWCFPEVTAGLDKIAVGWENLPQSMEGVMDVLKRYHEPTVYGFLLRFTMIRVSPAQYGPLNHSKTWWDWWGMVCTPAGVAKSVSICAGWITLLILVFKLIGIIWPRICGTEPYPSAPIFECPCELLFAALFYAGLGAIVIPAIGWLGSLYPANYVAQAPGEEILVMMVWLLWLCSAFICGALGFVLVRIFGTVLILVGSPILLWHGLVVGLLY